MIKAITAIILFIFFSSCSRSEIEKQNKIKEHAISDARNAAPEVYQAYLQCYALNYQDKNNCVKELAGINILQKWRDNHHYTKAFQYEAEKLGFVKFLRNHDLYCETIDDGPEFVTTAKAYLITCRNGNDYFMQFDSFKKEWKLVNDKEKSI